MESHTAPLTCVTDFGLDLFAQELLRRPARNTLVSPPNVYLLLALLHAGARGETQRRLAATLRCAGEDEQTLERVSTAIRTVAASPSTPHPNTGTRSGQPFQLQTPTVQLATAIWASHRLSFNATFAEHAREIFGVELSALDFSVASAASHMNDWVRACTDGYIADLFSEIDPWTVMCCATTLAFRGAWRDPFDRQCTTIGPFIRQDREPIAIPYMHQTDRFPYWEDDLCQIVAVPFAHAQGNPREFELVIILPKSDTSLAALQSDSSWSRRWATWMTCIDYAHRYITLPRGSLTIPRFTIAYASEPDLNPALVALGAHSLFDPEYADFGKMLPSPSSACVRAYLNRIMHKTMLSVNEEGVVAAAASGGIMELGYPPPIEFVMKVERPFYCLLWDRISELPLFLGAVNDPSAP